MTLSTIYCIICTNSIELNLLIKNLKNMTQNKVIIAEKANVLKTEITIQDIEKKFIIIDKSQIKEKAHLFLEPMILEDQQIVHLLMVRNSKYF